MHQKHLATGLRPDPLGEPTALPRALAGFYGIEVRRRGQTGKNEDRGGRGRRQEEGGATGKGGEGEEGNLAPTVISKSQRLCSTLVQPGLIKQR